MDAFEILFRQADADGDGKISGAEAVGFFRSTGLPQITLAKIWKLADQAQRGSLDRTEFIHALKLVTVAQSGRELTPEIARAAFTGPASSQIPPPRLSPPPQSAPPAQYRPPLQNLQTPPLQNIPPPSQSQPTFPPLQSQPSLPNPPPLGQSSLPSFPNPPPLQGQSSLPSFPNPPPLQGQSSLQNPPPLQSHSSLPSNPPPLPNPAALQNQLTAQTPPPSYQQQQQQQWRPPVQQNGFGGSSFQAVPENSEPAPTTSGSSTSTVTANGGVPADVFGSDSFKASASRPMLADDFGSGSQAEDKALVPVSVTPSTISGTAIVPATPSPPTSVPVQPFRPPAQTFPQPRGFTPGPPQGFNPAFQTAQPPGAGWPRMSQADVERYTQVFVGVDTDRDGKVRGDQARDLFLSWRLPRDVLKQIWDLSDQDGDSMLSLREFCIALYFMERYREGRPVPPVLPTGFLPEAPMPQPWQATFARPPGLPPQPGSSGLPPQRPLVPGGFPVSPQNLSPGGLPGSQTAGLMPVQASPAEAAAAQSIPYKSRVVPLEIELVNQLSREDQNTLKAKHQEAEAADRKVFDLDKDIKSATEMIEFYRAKLQEIILYKTRTDNQRLEISERLSADKREVEGLRKKYDLKFRQAGESNSRLQAEEVAFRDIQQRKMELYNAIAKIDQGKAGDLQSRAEEISADLNELKILLSQRAKSLGLRAKPTSAMELPFGWQPGIQENAVDWDDWDKFDDQGFTYFHRTEEIKPETAEKIPNGSVKDEKPAEIPKPAEESAVKSSEAAAAEEKVEASSSEKEKSEESTAEEHEDERRKEREISEAPPAPAPAPSWSSVFGDEPAWNLSQDFGNMGLKSIKTSAAPRSGDSSVPETPLFKSGEPETPLFTASQPETPLFTSARPDNQQQMPMSLRLGDESVPDTPLFKSPDSNSGRNAFARFDTFSDFGHFDDAASSSSASQAWSTF